MVCDCIVVGCSNNNITNPDRRFFVIPVLRKNEDKRELSERRRHEWIRRINRKTINSDTVKSWQRVCSDHFILGGPAGLADFINLDWTPTVKIRYDLQCLSTTLSSDRYKRKQMREHM
ncbi:hypothetical protein ACJMK2_014422 [Sinanodonta woodiana]|uniref:THAP-type domain-containing protein n=1 Tax=Sinanodonta woodiana TaxID=1069815 RepID=A0ABD3V3V5_SINWO